MKPIRCPDASAVTMVTVIVDADLHKMLALGKLDLLHGMASHLGMPPELLRLLPAGNKPMFDSSALVAGPGELLNFVQCNRMACVNICVFSTPLHEYQFFFITIS